MKTLFISSCLTFLIFLSACKKDAVTESSSIIKNQTNHTISIQTYKKGEISPELSFEIAPQEEKQVHFSHKAKEGNHIVSFAYLLGYQDSVKVTFDHTFSIIHYLSIKGNAEKYIAYESPENLINQKNWEQSVVEKSSKSGKKYTFTYKFSEQDYLDAKGD